MTTKTTEKKNKPNLIWDGFDYGRWVYMPDGFFKKDRFGQKYFTFSPCQYEADNPIKFIDVNGDLLWYRVNKNNTVLYEDRKLSASWEDGIRLIDFLGIVDPMVDKYTDDEPKISVVQKR